MCMGITKPHAHTRRHFLRQAAVGSSLICTFGQGWQNLLGMAKPIHILQRGSTGQDVLNLATIASVDAQARVPQN